MNKQLSNIYSLETDTINNLKNSKSINTLRAYKSDYDHFSNFCIKNGFISLPAQPNVISIYLTYLSKSSKYSTLKRRLVSISIIHKLKGHYIDIKNPIIINNLKGIKRIKGSFQIPKKPLLINNIKDITNIINQELVNIKSSIKRKNLIRNKAIILLGFSGGFRRSELVNIILEDIEFVSEGLKILIRKSKTDQFGEGFYKAIPYFQNEYCPVIALKEHIKQSEVKLKDNIFGVSDKSIALVIKEYAKKAGLDSSKYAGHSLRSGFATTAAEFGVEERNIMSMTGHKTTQMVRRYIQEANLFKNNALNKIKF